MSWDSKGTLKGCVMAAMLAVAPAAHATKIGGGVVMGAGDLAEDVVGGVQGGVYLGFPKIERLSFGADLSWFPMEGATRLAFDPNVRLTLIKLPVLDVYPLAGLDLLYGHGTMLGVSASEVDVGLLVGAGAEAKAGPLRPYAEAKLALQDHTWFALSAGLRIAF